MADEILRREGENILNEEGEVIARFEANNIIKLGASGIEIKTLEFVATGEDYVPFVFNEKPNYILGLFSEATGEVMFNIQGFPYVEGKNIPAAEAYAYSGGTGYLIGYFVADGNEMTIYGFSDLRGRLHEAGQRTIIYYI